MLRDENVQIWRSSPSGHLAGYKSCCLATIWVILAHFCWARNYLQLSYEFLRDFCWFCCFFWFCRFCRLLCWFCWMFMASKFPTVSVAVFVAVVPHWVPTSCSSQTHLQPLPVQTQGTQLLKLFIQIYYNNSHQHHENVTIEVSHSSMFKIHSR